MTKEKIYSFNISPSGLDLMGKCPLQWAHYNIYKTDFVRQESKPLQIGSAMHKLVEGFYRNCKTIKFNKDWLINNWRMYYNYRVNEDLRSEQDYQEGLASLDKLYRIMDRYGWLKEPLSLNERKGLELYFKFPYHGHSKYEVNMSGKIDLIVESYGDICLIDWKTGKSDKFLPSSLSDCFQIVLYAVALKKKYDININEQRLFLVYFYLDKVLEYKIDESVLYGIKDKINEFLDIYDTGTYEKREGTHCKFCAFREPCLKASNTTTDIKDTIIDEATFDEVPF